VPKGYARTPLAVSAQKAGLPLPAALEKDERGAPLPVNGLWWSVTHKSDYVAGVVARQRIGIDVEKITPFSPSLLNKIVSPEERRLFSEDPPTLFFRCWTAKEAVLKAEGKGLADMSRCRIEAVLSDTELAVVIHNTRWLVEHWFFNDHLAAVVKSGFGRVQWTLLDKSGI